MKAKGFDIKPVELLLAKHRGHLDSYTQEFHGFQLIISPKVFNPAYTKVSGFMADNLIVSEDSRVLDMFSGSGILSFVVAEKASSVLGLDISPYAVRCARLNTERLGFSGKVQFRVANLWNGVHEGEKFDIIIANPPLLPAIPEDWLEIAVADDPKMTTMAQFIQGCPNYLSDNGRVIMSFSNACKASFNNPLGFVKNIANKVGMTMKINAELNVGYEIYRVLEFERG